MEKQKGEDSVKRGCWINREISPHNIFIRIMVGSYNNYGVVY